MGEKTPDEVGYSRPGFLTKKDRQFLRELPDGDYPEKRHRIRQRTESAFRDFALLFEQLPQHDRQLLFEDYDDTRPMLSGPDNDLADNIASTLAFVCLALAEHGPVRNPGPGATIGHRVEEFHTLLHRALEKTYPRMGLVFKSVDVDVTSYDQRHIDNLKKQLRKGESVSPEGVRTLMRAGEIDYFELSQFISDAIEE